MTDDLNSVKTAPAQDRGYHHGALRAVLIEAAESVIAERGVDRFSLREVARRAGVSPAAPAHHFGDSRGLLTAVAAEAFRRFGDALAESDPGGLRERRIRAQGLAYVRFALAERAKFDTRFLQLGLHPGGGHTWMYRRIAGPQAVTAAVLLGQVMDGKEAERVGLVHRCVGARLAELQLRVLLEEMHKRRMRVHVAGDVERVRANFVHGFRKLEVEITQF